jgi:hypothetical protein
MEREEPKVVRDFAIGIGFGCAVFDDGHARCWGDGAPRLDRLREVSLVAAGGGISESGAGFEVCVGMRSGEVLCQSTDKPLHRVGDRLFPVRLAMGEPSLVPRTIGVYLPAGKCLLGRAGELLCWGDGVSAQYAVDEPTPRAIQSTAAPTPVADAPPLEDVAVGNSAVCGVTKERSLVCWGGEDATGQGPCRGWQYESVCRVAPDVRNVQHVIDVALGRHGCAIDGDHQVWCWGLNYDGRTGQPPVLPLTDEAPAYEPVRVDLPAADRIAVGGNTSCAVASGEVWCWGNQFRYGEKSHVPLRVDGLTDAERVQVSGTHACALTSTGELRCWGSNVRGELGDRSRAESRVPVRVRF